MSDEELLFVPIDEQLASAQDPLGVAADQRQFRVGANDRRGVLAAETNDLRRHALRLELVRLVGEEVDVVRRLKGEDVLHDVRRLLTRHEPEREIVARDRLVVLTRRHDAQERAGVQRTPGETRNLPTVDAGTGVSDAEVDQIPLRVQQGDGAVHRVVGHHG